jgi:esterase
MPRLASYRLGQGPRATVLMHGLLGSGANLRTLAQRWSRAAPGRTLLVPDLTGHGRSPALPEGADLAVLARDVLETARAEGLDGPLYLVGHSLGGRVALAAARLAPGAIAEVALLDIAPGPFDPSGWEALEALLAAPAAAPSRRALKEALCAGGLPIATAEWLVMSARATDTGCVWSFDRQALARLGRAISEEDLWPVVGTVPLTCVRGERSDCVTPADVARLRAAGCRVVALPAGHHLHVDAPEALLAALLELAPEPSHGGRDGDEPRARAGT